MARAPFHPALRAAALPLALFCGAVSLVVLYYVAMQLGRTADPGPATREFVQMFDLNAESNLPSWYSSFLWLIAAHFAFDRRGETEEAVLRNGWLALAVGCILLSLDESAMLHERVGILLDSRGQSPIYDWMLVGIPLTLLAGLFFVRFLLRLPRDTSVRMVLAGMIFLSGAIGMESVGALLESGRMADFPVGLTWRRIIAMEEFLEMSGVIFLIYTIQRFSRLETGPAAPA